MSTVDITPSDPRHAELLAQWRRERQPGILVGRGGQHYQVFQTTEGVVVFRPTSGEGLYNTRSW